MSEAPGSDDASAAPATPLSSSARVDAVTIVAVLVAAVLVGAAPTLRRWVATRASRAQCESLVDRWAEHVAYAQDPDAPRAELERRKRVMLGDAPQGAPSAAADEPVGSPARTARFEPRASRVERCEREVLDAEATCALAAGGLDELERCMR